MKGQSIDWIETCPMCPTRKAGEGNHGFIYYRNREDRKHCEDYHNPDSFDLYVSKTGYWFSNPKHEQKEWRPGWHIAHLGCPHEWIEELPNLERSRNPIQAIRRFFQEAREKKRARGAIQHI